MIWMRDPHLDRMGADEARKHPFIFDCDEQHCIFRCTADTMGEAQHIFKTHPCPTTGKTTYGWSVIVPAVRDLWLQADKYYTEYRELPGNDPRKEKAAGTLNGLCIALSHLMKPYFEDVSDVAKELGERFKDSARLTPGIENITLFPEEPTKWYKAYRDRGYTSDPAHAEDPPFGYPSDRVDRARTAVRGRPAAAATTRTPTPAPTTKQFTDEEKKEIKDAHAAGFSVQMLCTAWDCTLADLKPVLG